MTLSQPSHAWLGRTVGDRQRYLINERIGGGGMGEVFLTTDTLLGQSVALKLLNSKLANEEMRHRFEQEVAVSAALRSDHIVQVFDYGVTDEGYPFYVMEYLCGQTLGQLLKQEKRLSVERAVHIITQVCAGLSLAHQGVHLRWKGEHSSHSNHVKVIHRDLKPDNIFLVSTSLGEFVKILDFGIAKIRTEQIEHTYATNVFMGTYQYASPEQLRAEKNLDARADIYSLGIILYKMLSGAPPFTFEFEQQADLQPSGAVWAVAHLTKQPMPLRQQLGCEQIPPELEAIVMRCLEKSPQQRFATVLELSQALHEAVGLRDRELVEATYADWSTGTGAPFTISSLPNHLISPDPAAPESPTENVHLKPQALRLSSARSRRWLSRSALFIVSGLTVAVALGTRVHSLWSAASLSVQPSSTPSANPDAASSRSPAKSITQAATVRSAVKSLTGHEDTVWAVDVSPDGRTIASGSFCGICKPASCGKR
jgi:eukaryotic-like serine/threonine-protein kinase